MEFDLNLSIFALINLGISFEIRLFCFFYDAYDEEPFFVYYFITSLIPMSVCLAPIAADHAAVKILPKLILNSNLAKSRPSITPI